MAPTSIVLEVLVAAELGLDGVDVLQRRLALGDEFPVLGPVGHRARQDALAQLVGLGLQRLNDPLVHAHGRRAPPMEGMVCGEGPMPWPPERKAISIFTTSSKDWPMVRDTTASCRGVIARSRPR